MKKVSLLIFFTTLCFSLNAMNSQLKASRPNNSPNTPAKKDPLSHQLTQAQLDEAFAKKTAKLALAQLRIHRQDSKKTDAGFGPTDKE